MWNGSDASPYSKRMGGIALDTSNNEKSKTYSCHCVVQNGSNVESFNVKRLVHDNVLYFNNGGHRFVFSDDHDRATEYWVECSRCELVGIFRCDIKYNLVATTTHIHDWQLWGFVFQRKTHGASKLITCKRAQMRMALR